MNSEKTIGTIQGILTEPHLKEDAGGSASRVLPLFVLILSIIGLIMTAFFSWQSSSLTTSLVTYSTNLTSLDGKIESALSSLGKTGVTPVPTLMSPSQTKSLQEILQANKDMIDTVPVRQAEELQRQGSMSFKINVAAGGLLTLALMLLLFVDFDKGRVYRKRTKGSDEAAFHVYDEVIRSANFSRASIEGVVIREGRPFIDDSEVVKIARIVYLFQSTRIGSYTPEIPAKKGLAPSTTAEDIKSKPVS